MSPIKPEKRSLYPPNWDEIAYQVKARAGWKCELCGREHGKRTLKDGAKVVLTVHHINGDPTDNRKVNLIALCQKCHNRLDQPFRRQPPRQGIICLNFTCWRSTGKKGRGANGYRA